MIKDFTKRVFSLKFSVFSDEGVLSLDGLDSELIRVPGFGRPRKFRMANFEFRMEIEASSVGNGRYRTPKVGIGRLKNFNRRLGYGTAKYANYAKGEVLGRIGIGGGSQQRLPAVNGTSKLQVASFEFRMEESEEGAISIGMAQGMSNGRELLWDGCAGVDEGRLYNEPNDG